MQWVYRRPSQIARRPALVPTAPAVAGTNDLGITADSGQVAMQGTSLVTGSLGVTADTATVAATGASYYFADEFEGPTIDLSRWTVINRVEDLANNEIGCDEAVNVSINAGTLEGISQRLGSPHSCGDAYTAPANKNYSSWMIQQKKQSFIYPPGGEAIIDIRWKPGGGTGTWPAFWLLGWAWQANQPDTANIPTHDWPNGDWCEVDIAEFMGGSRTTVTQMIHNNGAHVGGGSALGFNASSQQAVYRLKWSSGSMIWQVDPEDGGGFDTLRTITGADVPAVPMYIVCNVAMGGTGGGTPDDGTLPVTSVIDYVRVTAIPGFTLSDNPRATPSFRAARNTLLRL